MGYFFFKQPDCWDKALACHNFLFTVFTLAKKDFTKRIKTSSCFVISVKLKMEHGSLAKSIGKDAVNSGFIPPASITTLKINVNHNRRHDKQLDVIVTPGSSIND